MAPAWRLPLLLPLLLLLLGSARKASAVSDQEVAAIQSLQAAVYYVDGAGKQVQGPPLWPSNLTGYNVCNLSGISCTNGAITTLDLSYKTSKYQKLQNNQPLTALNKLTNLQKLYLQGNAFTGPLPNLSGLTGLVELLLGYNAFSGTLPPEWSNLKNLKFLSLSDNPLSGPLPPTWGNLINLQRLEMSTNRLVGEIPYEWGSLTNLNYMYLSKNQLAGPLPSALSNLVNLSYLDLTGNKFFWVIPSEWGRLTNLRTIYLGNNQLSGPLPSTLKLVSLQTFDVHGNAKLCGNSPALSPSVRYTDYSGTSIGSDCPSSRWVCSWQP